MGWFLRKRVRIAPGVRLNVGSRRSSVTFGGYGAGYNLPLTKGNKKRASTGSMLLGCLLVPLFGIGAIFVCIAFVGAIGRTAQPQPKAINPVPSTSTASTPTESAASPDPAATAAAAPAENTAQTAERKLAMARTFVGRGEDATAKKRLTEIINDFPGTPAADEAKELLKKVE